MKRKYINPGIEIMTMDVKPLCVISGGGTTKLDNNNEHAVGAGSSLGHGDDYDW